MSSPSVTGAPQCLVCGNDYSSLLRGHSPSRHEYWFMANFDAGLDFRMNLLLFERQRASYLAGSRVGGERRFDIHIKSNVTANKKTSRFSHEFGVQSVISA